MFFVADTQKYKEGKIRDHLYRGPMIAVLLAAANFEWTVGRCILLFSETPNVEIRARLAKCFGLDRYKSLWQSELQKQHSEIPPLPEVIKHWKRFRHAFELRHSVVHGRGTCTRNMATEPVEIMLKAVDDLYKFADSLGKDLHARLSIRRK